MKKLSYIFLIYKFASNKILVLSFSISFACLLVILLIFCVIPLWDSAPAHSLSDKELNLFSNRQSNFTLSCVIPLWDSVKSSTFPLKKIPVFQGVAPGHKNFTLSCVIPLWDSATAHSPSGKEFTPFSLEESCFSRGLLLCNILILSCLGSLCFGNYSYFSLNPYVHLYYLWCISITKDRLYPKHFILCLVYFYSKIPPLSEIFYSMFGLTL